MVQTLVIPADSDQPIAPRRVSGFADYPTVVGGPLETVDVPGLGVTVFVNEEGARQRLPLNPRATFLWWGHVPQMKGRAMLVGDVVLVGRPGRGGVSRDVPGELVRRLTEPGRWQVEVRTAGDTQWHHHRAAYDNYVTTLMWAMMTLDRWNDVAEVRVVALPEDTATDVDRIRALQLA